MEDKDNHKNLWLALGAALVVLVLLFWWIQKSPGGGFSFGGNSAEEEVVPTEDISEGSVNKTVPAAALSYQQALVKYKDARIQLDKTCQAIPNNVTYKNGASIMLDNRSGVARTVKLGSTFSIKAWGFKIVKLSAATVPATWLMDCDKSQNVATVLIQK